MRRILRAFKKVFRCENEINFGTGIVVGIEEIPTEQFNPFFPIVMIPCEDIPQTREYYRLTIAMGGKKHSVFHAHAISKGTAVSVRYKKCLFGTKIEAIELPRKKHYLC